MIFAASVELVPCIGCELAECEFPASCVCCASFAAITFLLKSSIPRSPINDSPEILACVTMAAFSVVFAWANVWYHAPRAHHPWRLSDCPI